MATVIITVKKTAPLYIKAEDARQGPVSLTEPSADDGVLA